MYLKELKERTEKKIKERIESNKDITLKASIIIIFLISKAIIISKFKAIEFSLINQNHIDIFINKVELFCYIILFNAFVDCKTFKQF